MLPHILSDYLMLGLFGVIGSFFHYQRTKLDVLPIVEEKKRKRGFELH